MWKWFESLFGEKKSTQPAPAPKAAEATLHPVHQANLNAPKHAAKYGVEAAAVTESRISRWRSSIESAASSHSLPSSVVAAIISRETAGLDQFCAPPPTGKLGDNGNGHGPMQIDKRSFPEWCADWSAGKLSIDDGIKKGCEVLAGKLRALGVLLPEMPVDQRLRGAVAAYNTGEGNVKKLYHEGKDIDETTTSANYSSDVMERAKFFKTKGYA